MNDENSLGFMDYGRRSPGHDFPLSRDWEDIDCKATGCLYNVREKCATPSICKIGEDGRCIGFVVKKMDLKQIDGD